MKKKQSDNPIWKNTSSNHWRMWNHFNLELGSYPKGKIYCHVRPFITRVGKIPKFEDDVATWELEIDVHQDRFFKTKEQAMQGAVDALRNLADAIQKELRKERISESKKRLLQNA